jgi:hypothetical protein
MSSTCGRITTSARASSCFAELLAHDRDRLVHAPSMLVGRLPPALLEMSTAITKSAPSWRAASTGTGLTTPPST